MSPVHTSPSSSPTVCMLVLEVLLERVGMSSAPSTGTSPSTGTAPSTGTSSGIFLSPKKEKDDFPVTLEDNKVILVSAAVAAAGTRPLSMALEVEPNMLLAGAAEVEARLDWLADLPTDASVEVLAGPPVLEPNNVPKDVFPTAAPPKVDVDGTVLLNAVAVDVDDPNIEGTGVLDDEGKSEVVAAPNPAVRGDATNSVPFAGAVPLGMFNVGIDNTPPPNRNVDPSFVVDGG